MHKMAQRWSILRPQTSVRLDSMEQKQDLIRVSLPHGFGKGTRKHPLRLPAPKQNLEQMTSTDGGMAFLGLMLTDMGVEHATFAPFSSNKFTVLTIDGTEHSGVAVYEHGDYCDLEIEEGNIVTIAKRDVVALTRSVPPGVPAFPPSSKEERLRLITVGGREF